MARRQEALAFALAVFLHATALLVSWAVLGERVAMPPSRTPHSTLAFDIELGEFSAMGPRGEPERDAFGGGEQRVASARLGVRAPGVEVAPPEAVTLQESEGAELEVESEGDASRPIDLGLGPDGWQRWVTAPKAGAPARDGRPPARANRFQVFRAPPVSTTGGLQEGLEEHDRSLGLGPSGRVLSAFQAAAHQPVAPQLGTVRFDVKVSRTGAVEVTVGSASGDVESWRKVAQHVADDLRASLPRIAPPREGVKLVIELVAEETLPNGTKATSLHGPRIEVSPPKLESGKARAERLRKDNPTTKGETSDLPAIDLELPGIYLAERGKVCGYRLGLSFFGPTFQGGCDPSHVGAKPQRMVRTRVIEQTMF